jgi:antitoxin (DNA-binding transcriptional repressor) of toxin-antitoxin stability system
MKSYTIGEFKRQLPAILSQVAEGNTVVVEKGRRREKVAQLSPFQNPKNSKRKLGPLASRGRLKIKNWELGDQSLLEKS